LYRLEEELEKDAVCHQFCSTCTTNALPKKLYIGGQIIQTVKYADDLVLIAKEETVLQGMIDKLIEIGSWYGNECGKNKSNENFKTAIPSNNYDRPKTTGECGMF